MNIKEGFKILYTANGGDEADLKELSGNNNQHVISTIYGDGLSTKLPKNVVDNVEKMAKGGGSGSGELIITVEAEAIPPEQGQSTPTFKIVSVDKTYEEIEEAFNSRRGIVCNVCFAADGSSPAQCFKFNDMVLDVDMVTFDYSLTTIYNKQVAVSYIQLTLNYSTGKHSMIFSSAILQTKTN